MRFAIGGLLFVFACSTGPADDDGTGPAPDPNPGADAGANPDPTGEPARFIAVGDTGDGSEGQYAVAAAIRDKCAVDGCDFVLLLGDNIYDGGVTDIDDPQWQSKFEQPYADIDLPFYAVLGNHDYGGNLLGVNAGGIGNEFWKGPVEVAYTDRSSKWVMPATHYTLVHKNVGFIMLDTNSIMWDDTSNGEQVDWYSTALLDVADADWVFAIGHHPYLSNGSHGNAGNYEAIEIGGADVANPVPVMDGGSVKSFFDDVVCGTVDAYFAGHDHTRQWLDEPNALCGAEMIVSGAGAKVTAFSDRGNATHFADDQREGFMYVVVDGDSFTGQFIDRDGTVAYERTVTH